MPRALLLSLLVGLPLLAGCLAPAPTAPLPLLTYGSMDARQNPHLLVLLRGFGAGYEVFETEGIIAEIRRRRLPFDVVVPDAHFGYYQAQTIEERLHEDIIVPYRQRGYRQIWLAGFSMGGMGSLFHLKYYPRDVDGVLLTSPFLGWGGLAEEIRGAGGVAAWQGVSESEAEWERLLWSWIKRYSEQRDAYPPVYLGYGSGDLIAADGPALLATVLPAERVFAVPGNHTIATFKRIFSRHLDLLEASFAATGRHAEPAAPAVSTAD